MSLRGDAGHLESLGRGVGQADLERIGPGGNVIGGIGVAFGGAGDQSRERCGRSRARSSR
jgi:hypothetical protein